MVDHKVHGNQRTGELGIGAERLERVAHSRQIDHARHAGEVLKQHAGWSEVDLLRGSFGVPARDILDVGMSYRARVFETQQVLEENLDGIRDARNGRYVRFFERLKGVDAVLPVPHPQTGGRAEAILLLHFFNVAGVPLKSLVARALIADYQMGLNSLSESSQMTGKGIVFGALIEAE